MHSEGNTVGRSSVYAVDMLPQLLGLQRSVQCESMADGAPFTVRRYDICIADLRHCLNERCKSRRMDAVIACHKDKRFHLLIISREETVWHYCCLCSLLAYSRCHVDIVATIAWKLLAEGESSLYRTLVTNKFNRVTSVAVIIHGRRFPTL